MRRRVAIAVAAASCAVAAAAAPASPVRAACTPGVHPFGDVSARTFCGPAKATLVTGGRTIRFSGGECQRGPAYVSVNIGTVVLGVSRKPREYFGLNVGKVPLLGGSPAAHDGTFPAQAIAAHHGTKGYAILQGSVTLAGGRTRGTFSGKVLGGGTAHGTFRC
jgi:hypothetical protein